MRESKTNTILNQYLREKRLYCYYELKVVRGLFFSFDRIEINQDEGMPALAANGLVWKISDLDSRKKPCDGFCTPPLPAYLVLKFNEIFYFLEYHHITRIKEEGRNSISFMEVQELSTRSFKVKS